MAKKHTAEQVMLILRQVEIGIGNGKKAAKPTEKRASWNKPAIGRARSTAD